MKKKCAICGIKTANTSDHIPPKGLYPKPRDNDINLNTVPACMDCNGGGSEDDEVFKLVVGIDTGEHQAQPDRQIESLAATIGNNQRLANSVFGSAKIVPPRSAVIGGESVVEIAFDRLAYERVVVRIVKGLHWMERKSSQDAALKTRVILGTELDQKMAGQVMDLMLKLPLRWLNKETFSYCFQVDDLGCGIWGMQIFGKHTVFAITSFD